jgi:pseudaminic acid synthase
MNKSFNIKGREVGENAPCYIIAEMSANHGGDKDKAIEIIHEAKRVGADCIKIQTYTADTLTIPCDNDYFQIHAGTWKGENLHALYQKAYTPWEWQAELKEEAEKIGLAFLSTAYDSSSVDFLEELKVDFYKIASFEAVDIPLIRYIASKHKPIIMSVGMASLGEIEDAVSAVSGEGNEDLCLLKCSSAYPAIPEEMNLKTITNMRETFDVPVGLSDHSLGSLSALIAVSLGACVVEKHICLSREFVTPDSSFSMEPAEFKQMIDDIHAAEKALGKISYAPSEGEVSSTRFRKSIFIVEDMEAGDVFTPENLRIIRPSDGLPPKLLDAILGKRVSKRAERGTPLTWELIG